jgi:DNA-binding response OmpR family regulator
LCSSSPRRIKLESKIVADGWWTMQPTVLGGAGHVAPLMLTAAATIEDRVDGLGLGADDYLPKPFAFAELVARVRALGRRSRPAMLVWRDIRLDPAHRAASRAGLALALGPKEFAVLEELLAAGGAVVSTETLLDRVWGESADPFSQAVKVTVSRLRAKLGPPTAIETVAPGYRMGPAG